MHVAIPMELHRDTKKLVVFFAGALARKLLRAEEKYGFANEWVKDDWRADCIDDINRHLKKGDPLDVAAYAAFAWFHNWRLRHQAKPKRLRRPKQWAPALIPGVDGDERAFR